MFLITPVDDRFGRPVPSGVMGFAGSLLLFKHLVHSGFEELNLDIWMFPSSFFQQGILQ